MVNVEKSRVEAQDILKGFAKELSKIKTSEVSVKDDGITTRYESNGQICDKEFRTIMFKNAPKKDEECLIVEKGNWV